MADTDKKNKSDSKDEAPKPAEAKIGIVAWAVMITVVASLSGSGFVLGRLFADLPAANTETAQSQDTNSPSAEDALAQTPEPPKASAGTWYYEGMKSIVVNPDEPGATRFVRVGLILEVSDELSQDQAKTMFETKSPLLINWLNLYFKSLSLSQMENEKDMNRILSQVCDGFNEILFPDAKPHIKKVLIREFNIQ